MKDVVWNKEKDVWLRKKRGVSFEEVRALMSEEKGIEIDHYNPVKYPGQNIYVVTIHGYCYLVPYEETEDTIILKTIIPSRKATKKYLKGKYDEEKKD